ncbi:hypothetical protein [Halarchaeum sp. P4]|uniref:hypothetical protein n=1 Tax=Halarchaeum sp. P4 TaxID=3421639 RepID=UPI003EBE1406
MSPRRNVDGPASDGPLSIEADEDGLTVFDAIERHQIRLGISQSSSLRRLDPEGFRYPIDSLVAVDTEAIELPTVVAAFVQDADGEMVEQVDPLSEATLDAGTYTIELTTPVKLYVRADGPMTVDTNPPSPQITFDESTTVQIGARSRHEHPAGTITTTTDPVDMMTAVSHLGSALKTHSPERSYPTLRGHPPLIEVGEELDVPETIETPDTDITIEIPAEYRSIYVATPLAYYLGATLEPSPAPKIVAGDYEYRLDTTRGFEAEVEAVLKRLFLLDCVVRSEGVYGVDIHEREALEERLDLDWTGLFEAPLAERVATFLEVPHAEIEDHVPGWKQTTHVAPTPNSVELLPFLVNDLAVVRSPQTQDFGSTDLKTAAVRDFMRGEDGATAAEPFTRSVTGTASKTPNTVRPAATDSVEQAWIGEGAPLGASKPTTTAFKNRLARDRSEGDIRVTVVCNDAQMDTERDLVNEVYGDRDDLPFTVSVYRNLSTADLRDVLTEPADLFHFIGHIDGEGFKCADGLLDAATLDEVGVDAFFLNACQSYGQGMELIERGGIGGVVTVRDVVNRGAEAIGHVMARLLNRGFPLSAALDIASDESIMSNRYVVIGDSGFTLSQAESRTPVTLDVDSEATDDATLSVTLRGYPTDHAGMGSVLIPAFGDGGERYLASGSVTTETMTPEELLDVLSMESIPVRLDGELHWSSDLTYATLHETLSGTTQKR